MNFLGYTPCALLRLGGNLAPKLIFSGGVEAWLDNPKIRLGQPASQYVFPILFEEVEEENQSR